MAIHDTGQEGKRLYVVTELLEGETMRSRLRQGPLGVRKAAEHAARVAEGLAAAHEKGIVHRDIKPDNLMLTSEGTVKIGDLGLAKKAEDVAGEGGAIFGTPHFIAPEQAQGKSVDHRSPNWSMAPAGVRRGDCSPTGRPPATMAPSAPLPMAWGSW